MICARIKIEFEFNSADHVSTTCAVESDEVASNLSAPMRIRRKAGVSVVLQTRAVRHAISCDCVQNTQTDQLHFFAATAAAYSWASCYVMHVCET